MIALPLAVIGLVGTMKAGKMAGKAVGGLQVFRMKKKIKKQKRAFQVNENPELMRHKAETAKKMTEAGLPPPEPDAYVLFDVEPDGIPPEMHHLCGSWILTEREATHLFDMMRRDMLDRGAGACTEEVERLCKKYKIPFNEIANATWRGGPVDYSELKFFSHNRMNDPIIRAQFQQEMNKKQ